MTDACYQNDCFVQGFGHFVQGAYSHDDGMLCAGDVIMRSKNRRYAPWSEVPVTHGDVVLYAKVSDADLATVTKYRWSLNGKGYAHANMGQRVNRCLHHLIVRCPTGMVRDHDNEDKLDNRRENLKLLSNKDNVRKSLATQRKGYTLTPTGKYAVYIYVNNKKRTLGTVATEKEAVALRKQAIDYYWYGIGKPIDARVRSPCNKHKGVSWSNTYKRWRAYTSNPRVELGLFTTEQEALAALRKAKHG